MPKPKNRVPLLGSERVPLPGARVSGRLDPNERISVTLITNPRQSLQDSSVVSEFGTRLPRGRSYLTREEFDATYGASRDDLAKVEAFAQEYALDIVEESPARRSVVLSGTIAQLGRAFDVKLVRYRHPKGIYRGRSGPIYLPVQLAPVVQAVLGLDDRPQAKSHIRLLKKRAAAGGITYTPPQVAQFYDYPSGLDGTGQSVAIIELGGGYTTQDLKAYFSGLGIPTPSVLSISVDGSSNSPTGDPNGPDAEVMLDIEVIGSIAPKAQVYVYFAPNTDAGFVDAVGSAVHDSQHKPSVISISWGDAEVKWTKQGMQALDNAFQDAVNFVAAGETYFFLFSSDFKNLTFAFPDFTLGKNPVMDIEPYSDTLSLTFNENFARLSIVLASFSWLLLQPVIEAIVPQGKPKDESANQHGDSKNNEAQAKSGTTKGVD